MCHTRLQQQTKHNIYLQCTLQWSEKGRVVKSNDLPYLRRQRHVPHGQLDKSNSDNTCPSLGDSQATSTYNCLTTCRGYHTRQWTILVHTQALHKLVTLQLSRLLPQRLDKLTRYETISFDTRQSLSPGAWGAYILSRTHKIYMASYKALKDTCQPSMSSLQQERRHSALSSQPRQLTGYL